ncbi:MAG: hypothetical protein ACM3S5_03315 [Rhodospirillales bacterium]
MEQNFIRRHNFETRFRDLEKVCGLSNVAFDLDLHREKIILEILAPCHTQVVFRLKAHQVSGEPSRGLPRHDLRISAVGPDNREATKEQAQTQSHVSAAFPSCAVPPLRAIVRVAGAPTRGIAPDCCVENRDARGCSGRVPDLIVSVGSFRTSSGHDM